jgi:hypothetical protein
MLLSRADQHTLLEQLSAMPAFFDEACGGVSAPDARAEGADGFSPIEQCWHLADLEREGYAVRIRWLLTELEPALPDFDGERVAQERNYKSLLLEDTKRGDAEARRRIVQPAPRLRLCLLTFAL